jgi:KUP system potassium uptake protein
MVTLAAILVWRISPWIVFLPWLTIACVDGTYLSAALVKVPDGAWFTLTLSIVLASIFILWRWGKERQWFAEAEDRFPTTHFVTKNADGDLSLTDRYGGTSLSRIKGFGIFFDKAGETTPIIFSQFVRKLTTVPDIMVFFHLRPLETPTVPPERRYHVSRLAIPNCYRLIARHGYMDEVISPDLALLIYEQVRDHIVRRAIDFDAPTSYTTGVDPTGDDGAKAITANGKAPDVNESSPIASATTLGDAEKRASLDAGISEALDTLQRAFDHEILYIIGKEQMRIKENTNFVKRVLLSTFLFLRDNTRTKIANLRVRADRVLEVGFVKDI